MKKKCSKSPTKFSYSLVLSNMTILYEITFQFFLSDTLMLTNDCHGVIRVEILAHPSENKTDGGNMLNTPHQPAMVGI